MNFEGILGGQFAPFLGGQFKSASRGQFVSVLGGQFDRHFHFIELLIVMAGIIHFGYLQILVT